MPNSRSLRRVVLVWLLRAWALRCWWYMIFAAVFSSNLSEAGWSLSHQDCNNAAMLVCSWHTVNSRFFPQSLPQLGEKQVTHRRQPQVAFQSQITPPLSRIQADFSLVILKTAFHPPA